MCEFYRVLVKGVLECQTDVHVGDGGDEVIEKERFQVPGKPGLEPRNSQDLIDNTTHYNTCVSRSSGELVLPGSTLRGSLRSSLSGVSNETIRESLFGPDKVVEGGQRGGIVRVDDAFRKSCGDESQVRYWHSDRETGLRIGIGIDAVTETAKPKALFYYEIYPAGTRFNVSLAMDWVDQEDIKNLKMALQCWNGDISGNLGSHKSKSWGVMKWNDYTISTIKTQAVREWFNSLTSGSIEETIEKEVHEKYDSNKDSTINGDRELTLTTLQPLLVDDPGRVIKGEFFPNKETYRTTRGEFAIPAESFAGACRGEARRIATTLVYQKTKNHQIASELAKEMIDNLFGATSQGSRIQFSDFVHNGSLDPHNQWFNAIDRFTSGVAGSEAGGKLYNVVAIRPKVDLECAGIGFPRGLKPWQAGLVYLVFRELHAKRFWLGGSRAKGYGLVGLKDASFDQLKKDLVTKAKKKTIQETVTALQEEVTQKVNGRCENEQPLSGAIYGSPNSDSSTGGNGAEDSTRGEQLNPYAFVPVKALWNAGNCPAYDEIKEEGIRHDLYIPERHTGIITCTLETVTDTLVGNEHNQLNSNEETTVRAYRHADRIAFPANSLRGMIGNVIETLSQSSLRVLENRYLSIRKLPNKKRPFRRDKYSLLSAIGRVIKQDGDWYIEPLTLPHLRSNGKTVQVNNKWKQAFSGVPFRECLSAYINPGSPTSYGPGNQDVYKFKTDFNNGITVKERLNYTEPGLNKKGGQFILGQCAISNSLTKCETGDADLGDGEIKGYIHVLAENGHKFPSNRTHELFIPEPITPRVPIRMTSAAKDKFDRLCKQAISAKDRVDELSEQTADKQAVDEQTERLVMPTGYKKHQLQENMLLCFDIASVSGQLEVSEISFSSIWREQFELETTCEAFTAIDEYLLPWGTLPGRNWLTPAEAMLGVVEEVPNVDSQRNLASRLRFTDGLFVGDGEPMQITDEVPLKILASPKPPSPNLYFHKAPTAVKHNILPNGRKTYLRHHSSQVSSENYRTKDVTENRKQKIICKPIKEGQNFTFDIHYRNFDDDEMKLLLTAIEPGGDFLHKLGLGKPLGLGSVKIKIESIEERDIGKCFDKIDQEPTCHNGIDAYIKSQWGSKNSRGNLVDSLTLECLKSLGAERGQDEFIGYPLTLEQLKQWLEDKPGAERKLYEWHSANTSSESPARLYEDSILKSLPFHPCEHFGKLKYNQGSREWEIDRHPNFLFSRRLNNKLNRLDTSKQYDVAYAVWLDRGRKTTTVTEFIRLDEIEKSIREKYSSLP